MNRSHLLLPAFLLGLAAATGSASAQLKPPSGAGAPAAAPAPSGGSASSSVSAPTGGTTSTAEPAAELQEKAAAGRMAATAWLALLDRRDWGTAWESSGRLLRNNVPLGNWMEVLPKARGDLGNLVERIPAETVYKDRIEGQPQGDYVTTLFFSKYEKRELQEIITTTREPDGRWRVTGYSVR